jgi:signal transduction histidine kinase
MRELASSIMDRIRTWSTAMDPDVAYQQYLLNVMLLSLGGTSFLYALIMVGLWVLGLVPSSSPIFGLIFLPPYVLSYRLGRQERIRLAAYIASAAFFLNMIVKIFQVGIGPTVIVGLGLVVVIAGVLVDRRATRFFLLLSAAVCAAGVTARLNGNLLPALRPEIIVFDDSCMIGSGMLQLTALIWFSIGKLRRAIERERALTAKLTLQSQDLERQVAERTADLTIVNEQLQRANEQLQREIAERKQAEEALERQAQELARSNAELESFAYIASHDLQEPLRKVVAFGDRLQAKYGETLGEQGRDYLERMQSAAARMQALINALLTYSRVTTKAQPFVLIDLDRVAREVVSDLETRIEQLGGRVEVGDLPTVDADPMQMRQLLQNLIGNALKFHREDEAPVVKIRAERLNGREGGAAGGSSGDAWYRIMVEDNGIGFDEKYLDQIFQVFQRLHGRSEYEGSGIGLATCRKIMERHGGSITARSAPGQGATFIVTLPAKQYKGEGVQ